LGSRGEKSSSALHRREAGRGQNSINGILFTDLVPLDRKWLSANSPFGDLPTTLRRPARIALISGAANPAPFRRSLGPNWSEPVPAAIEQKGVIEKMADHLVRAPPGTPLRRLASRHPRVVEMDVSESTPTALPAASAPPRAPAIHPCRNNAPPHAIPCRPPAAGGPPDSAPAARAAPGKW